MMFLLALIGAVDLTGLFIAGIDAIAQWVFDFEPEQPAEDDDDWPSYDPR